MDLRHLEISPFFCNEFSVSYQWDCRISAEWFVGVRSGLSGHWAEETYVTTLQQFCNSQLQLSSRFVHGDDWTPIELFVMLSFWEPVHTIQKVAKKMQMSMHNLIQALWELHISRSFLSSTAHTNNSYSNARDLASTNQSLRSQRK